MDSMEDLLARKNLSEPSEIRLIKKFIKDKYQADVSVAFRETYIAIAVPSAALAGTLRHDLPELQEFCDSDKKIIIRIGA